MTLIEIAAGLSGYTIPDTFVPVVGAAPVAPMDMYEKFGTLANNPTYYVAFNDWYNLGDNTWSPDPQSIIDAPAPFRVTVAAWLVSIQTYASTLLAWEIEYELQKDIQWREKMANAILLL
jgi:hypothetical protein